MSALPSRRPEAGFTLVEVLIAMTLGLIIMSGVMSTFVYLGRSLARLANQQTLEAEGRRTVLLFSQDVHMAQDVTSASDTAVTLTVPTSSGTASVSYTYYGSATTLGGVSIPALSFVRRVDSGTPFVLARDLVNGANAQPLLIKYYDVTDFEISSGTVSTRLRSIKKMSLEFSSQTGAAASGARTPVHSVITSLLLLRNKTGY